MLSELAQTLAILLLYHQAAQSSSDRLGQRHIRKAGVAVRHMHQLFKFAAWFG